MNFTSSYHYDANKLELKCQRSPYDPLNKTGAVKRTKASNYVY
jgi:hypothetical protein